MIKIKKIGYAAFCSFSALVFGTSGFSQQNVNDPSVDHGNVANDQGQFSYNGINQNPWFNNPSVRQEMNWNDNQFQQLNQNYGMTWNKYVQNFRSPYDGLSDEQRMQRQQELYGTFNKDFSQSTTGVFSDAAAAQRYNQLYLQYRGYGAFSDPAVQQELRLTTAQRRRFNQYDRDWNRKMHTWSRQYDNDPDSVVEQYNNTRNQYEQTLKQHLTPQQQRAWSNLSGEPYNFTPDLYFQNGVNATNANDARNANPPAATSSNPTTGGAPAGNPK